MGQRRKWLRLGLALFGAIMLDSCVQRRAAEPRDETRENAGTIDAGTRDSGILGGGEIGRGDASLAVNMDAVDAAAPQGSCEPSSCAAHGWACGALLSCGTVVRCADEGLRCHDDEVCVGGSAGPAHCEHGVPDCEVCSAIPRCDLGQTTRIVGRVVTPGRTDGDIANQVPVPNAVVYLLRTQSVSELVAAPAGIPSGGMACERCEDQKLGSLLVGAITDPTGGYTLEGSIPVGEEFVLVVQAGKFRRAVRYTLSPHAACTTTMLPTALPANPTRLPRSMQDGLAVNLPRIAISTGQIDAMECVFEKLGVAHGEFGNPGEGGDATARIHLYRGGSPDQNTPPGTGAYLDQSTPHDAELYGALERLLRYDLVVADCEGMDYDQDGSERAAYGANLIEYVNRGGRLFLSHLSYTWLLGNGAQSYSAADPLHTGLSEAADWSSDVDGTTLSGTGVISIGRPRASPRIADFAAWMEHEAIASPADHAFAIVQPRSQCAAVGDAAEEFVHLANGDERVEQFSFSTPYGAPPTASCGRVAYSGFHVSAGDDGHGTPYRDVQFPEHCTGDLTNQEKVLLYMLFDVSACVGQPPIAPACEPLPCDGACGLISDGCAGVTDCGPCRVD